MKTVGKQLQEARVAKGWSPEMAARETKIKIDRLHDLEADDFTNFSSPTYARGFVRTYARALGIDEYRILRQLDNKLPEDDNATFVGDQAGVPYMPESTQKVKPFEVGRGVYVAGGVGLAMLVLAGFILLEAYRADYFATSTPTATAAPITTNVAATVPDTGPSRAMPLDSNAPPVALPVDTSAAPANTPVDTNAAPRATAVSPSELANDTNVPVAQPVSPASIATPVAAVPANLSPAPATTSSANAPTVTAVPTSTHAAPSRTTVTISANPPTAPAVSTTVPMAASAPGTTTVPPSLQSSPAADASVVVPPSPGATTATPSTTVPTTTATPPRALPVDLNALNSGTATNAPVADAIPAPAPRHHLVHSLSARQANSRPVENDDSDSVAADTGTTAAAPAQLAANAQAASEAPPLADAPNTASSLAPSVTVPESNGADAALTGTSASGDSSTPSTTAATGSKSRSKRLVLTASHDSFIRVISLDGANTGQLLYSSVLHSGHSISFDERKYSINVANSSAVDIDLDGVNYGPHSDAAQPDTFTVESHTP